MKEKQGFKIVVLSPVLLLLIALLFISAGKRKENAVNEDNFVSVEKCLKDGDINAQIKGLGGFQEECIAFNLENLTTDTLKIRIEAGRRLTSVDSTLQDIFLVRDENLILFPNGHKTLKGYGFCCQSSNHSPQSNSGFTVGYMAPETWQQVAHFIGQNTFPESAIQAAVWVLSDDHPVSSIWAPDLTDVQSLREMVAEIKGVEVPWYIVKYENDTSMVFSNRPEWVKGEMNYYVRTNSMVSINVRSSKGMLITTLVKEMSLESGHYTYSLDLNVKGWPRGDYECTVYENFSNVLLKKKFKI
jgi:hypothetical protein